jgi:hypothetical protein
MAHDFGRNIVAKALEFVRCGCEIFGVPQDDRSDNEVQARCTIGLVLEGAVARFAQPVEENGPSERIACLSLVGVPTRFVAADTLSGHGQ